MTSDMKRFVDLRKTLTEIRGEVESNKTSMTPVQRDIVMIAQAEALCDLAATLNAGINVSTD